MPFTIISTLTVPSPYSRAGAVELVEEEDDDEESDGAWEDEPGE